MIAVNLLAGVFGADRDTIDSVTDVLGIGAVLVALALFVVLESRRAAGKPASRRLGVGAFAVAVLALVIIGGRFQWIPDADDGEPAVAVGDSSDDGDDASSSTTATVDDDEVAAGGDDSGDSTTSVVVGPPTPSTTTSTTAPVDDAPPPDTDDEVSPPADPSDPDRGPPSGSSYEVVVGDNFWAIAADMLEAESGESPSDAEVLPYWQALIDANADQLVEPGNPDLIVPGQVLDVPPIGGASP